MIQFILKAIHVFIFVNALITSEIVYKNLNRGELWKVDPKIRRWEEPRRKGLFSSLPIWKLYCKYTLILLMF